jgi:hypothetical protein
MRLAVLTVVGASIGAPATPEWGRSIAQAAPVYYVAADKLQQSQGVLMMT